MILAKNEVLVKNWNYACSKQGMTKTSTELTVTNKRIIYTRESNIETTRNEILVDNVKGINFYKNFSNKLTAILYTIFGAFLSIIIVGIPLLVKGLRLLSQGGFVLEITTKGQEGSTMLIGASNIVKPIKRKGKLKVKIDKNEINDIIETLGAIIIENQQ